MYALVRQSWALTHSVAGATVYLVQPAFCTTTVTDTIESKRVWANAGARMEVLNKVCYEKECLAIEAKHDEHCRTRERRGLNLDLDDTLREFTWRTSGVTMQSVYVGL
jgi:hypothetical protein